MTPEQASARAALLLIRRLVANRGLTAEEAVTAVAQRRRRETGPHTDLVVAEALAVVEEAMAPLRQVAAALAPVVQAAAEAMGELLRALTRATTARKVPASGPDRPAWATPYGPPPRRR